VVKVVEKNKKKLENKRRRNLWGMNPRTRKQDNGKKYNRQKEKLKTKEF
jgi:hypothetical protein